LLLLARRVAWYEKPDEALSQLSAFIAQVMAYGSAADVKRVEQFISEEGFSIGTGNGASWRVHDR
jgi:hypothetical protein